MLEAILEGKMPLQTLHNAHFVPAGLEYGQQCMESMLRDNLCRRFHDVNREQRWHGIIN